MTYDLVLRGGRVIDPSQGIDMVTDVAFTHGRVAAVGDGLSKHARAVEDVAGLIVTPGLIDLHTHVYWGGTSLGGGSARAGKRRLHDARRYGKRRTRQLPGLSRACDPAVGSSDPRLPQRIVRRNLRLFEARDGRRERRPAPHGAPRRRRGRARQPRHARGNQGAGRLQCFGQFWARPLDIARQVAEQVGLPMMVHIDVPPPTLPDVLARMRQGDILTHCFRPFPNTPRPRTNRAPGRHRGPRARRHLRHRPWNGLVLVRHGANHARNGFEPDCISSDVHALCIDGSGLRPPHDDVEVLCLGMPFVEVIRAATENPASALRRPDLGTFKPGSVGDATVLSLEEGTFDLWIRRARNCRAVSVSPQGMVIGGAIGRQMRFFAEARARTGTSGCCSRSGRYAKGPASTACYTGSLWPSTIDACDIRLDACRQERGEATMNVRANSNLIVERPTFVTHLECAWTGEAYEADKPHNLSRAGKPLLVRYDLPAIGSALTKEALAERPHDLWRWRELLPVRRVEDIVSLGEIATPLIPLARSAARLGGVDVSVKDEGRWCRPDRSRRVAWPCAVSMAKALRLGIWRMPSNGNAGAALSAYASRAGISETTVFLSRRTTPGDGNLSEESLFRAPRSSRVNGLIDDCGKLRRAGQGRERVALEHLDPQGTLSDRGQEDDGA